MVPNVLLSLKRADNLVNSKLEKEIDSGVSEVGMLNLLIMKICSHREPRWQRR